MSILANTAKYLGFEEIAESTNILTSGILNRTGARLMRMPYFKGIGKSMYNLGISKYPLAGPGFKRFGRYGRAAWRNMARDWWGGANGWQRAARIGALAGTGYAAYKGAGFVTDGNRPLWKRAGAVGAVGLGARLLSSL